MFCTSCGKKLEDTAKFCTGCGTPTKKQQPTQTIAAVEAKPVNDEQVVNEQSMEPIVEQPTETKMEQPVEANAEKSMEPIVEQPAEAKMVQPVEPIVEQVLGSAVSDSHNPVDPSISEELPTKKGKKKIVIVAVACAVVLLAGAGVGYYMYQNHIMKQADHVMAYLDDGEYDESIDVYEKYSGKKEAFDDKVFEGLKVRAEQIKEDYASEKLDYNTALDQIYNLEEYDIKKIDKLVKEIAQYINRINTSREDYNEAKAYYELGDYGYALEKYSLVLKEDDKYYKLAAKDIEQIEQEEADRQKEEEMNGIRDQALWDAESYAYDYDYENAIYAIEQGLAVIPEDQALTDMLTYYKEVQEMVVSVATITSTKYEQIYNEQDKDFISVSIEIPVLEGDNPAYTWINQELDRLKESYIASSEELAEDARLYASEEFFYPYSYEITYSVQYNDNGVLSFMMDGYIYTGGAHGFPVRDVYTFDLASGTTLSLSDLIATDETIFGTYVTEEFQRMFEETPEEYWPDAPETVQRYSTNFYDMNYYIMKDGINIFFYPYDLGSYARGFVDIFIPYAGNEGMFEFLQ